MPNFARTISRLILYRFLRSKYVHVRTKILYAPTTLSRGGLSLLLFYSDRCARRALTITLFVHPPGSVSFYGTLGALVQGRYFLRSSRLLSLSLAHYREHRTEGMSYHAYFTLW